MKRNIRQSLTGSRQIRIVTCLLVIVALSACGEEEKKSAQGLVKAGTSTSEQLAKYYGSLAQERAEYISYYRLELARTGRAVPPELDKAFIEQEAALTARAAMASKLKGVYSSLGELIDYDAPGEVTAAAKDLQTEIESVANKKLAVAGMSAANTTAILNKAVKALVEWTQFRQFKKNSKNAGVVLDSIIQLYQAEQPIYVQIAQDYDSETKAVALYLYTHGQASGLSSFQKALERYEMQANAGSIRDDVVDTWNLDNINRKYQRFLDQSTEEASSLLRALQGLKKRQEDFLNGKKSEKDTKQ